MSFAYGLAMELIIEQGLDYLGNAGIKVGLSNSTHVPDKDDQFCDDVGADDFIDGELSGTGYTGGFGGSGRKVLASKAVVYDTTNDRVELDAADSVWTAINAGTIEWATILDETGQAADTTTPVVINVDLATTVTNGGDITIEWDTEGILQLKV